MKEKEDTYQCFVNDTLREYLDVFCVCYLDDILMYSVNLADHRKQVKRVLQKLSNAGMFVKPEKYEFETTKTTFLGFVLSQDGISMDTGKVSAVMDRETQLVSEICNVSWDLQTSTRDL